MIYNSSTDFMEGEEIDLRISDKGLLTLLLADSSEALLHCDGNGVDVLVTYLGDTGQIW